LAMPMDFVDPSTRIVALQLRYSAWDDDSLVIIRRLACGKPQSDSSPRFSRRWLLGRPFRR
jgi:hypothetical protein